MINRAGKSGKPMSNTCIAFETDDSRFKKVSDDLIEFLCSKKSIPAVPTDRPFHVSVAYISKEQQEEDLMDLLEDASGAGRFKGHSFIALSGRDGSEYIALKVTPSPQFIHYKSLVNKETQTNGITHFHVSLAKLPQAHFYRSLMDEINDEFNADLSIKSDRILLYDNSHKVYRSMEANLDLIEHLEAKNRLSRHALESTMRRILDRHTQGVFKDSYWHPISEIRKVFAQERIDMNLVHSKYFHPKPDSQRDSRVPDGKEWLWEIPYTKGGWYLRIVASFGPSPISDPTSKYDLVATLTWSSKVQTEKLSSIAAKLRRKALT